MRKENSSFHLKFLSQPGVRRLHNNDYYGCSELDGFACYVVADGFSGDNKEDPSARMAVEAVISAFDDAPSISRRALRRYVQAAHTALRENTGKQKLRASLTVAVTNYQKLRYAYAGNSRFQLFRKGKLMVESQDLSYSGELVEEGELLRDKVAIHEERNNLYSYLGQVARFDPAVSKKIKLKNNDIFTLITKGIWENADISDMRMAIQSAENDPEKAAYGLERIILDKTPPDGTVENYTVCFVFVDKVFLDASKRKRIKLIIILSVIVLVVLAVIIILLVWRSNKRADMRANMEMAFHNGTAYTQGGNFVRAREEFATAYDLATKLKDRKYQHDIGNYQQLVEAIIYADDKLGAADFEAAADAYRAAENQSRYADNLCLDYIEKKHAKAVDYISVHGYLELGDTLTDTRDYENAEKNYLLARKLATGIYYGEGKQQAIDSLNALYEKMRETIEEQLEYAQSEVAAAEFIVEGDNALREGDLVSALLFYQLARDKFEELGNAVIVQSIDEKIALVDIKETQNEYQAEYAGDYVTAGDTMMEQGEYADAKRFYLLAREIYANLGDATKLDSVQTKIETVDGYLTGASAGTQAA